MFLLFVHITWLFYRQEYFIFKGRCRNKKNPRLDIAKILIKSALYTNQSMLKVKG